MEKQILHVDVNNAFLSWTAIERLKNGETLDIRTIPAIIGGDEAQRKGVVLAKSNIAKQFGIQTGEPIYFARKKCPSIQIFSSNHSIYKKYSDALYNILNEYTDKIERFSIDECFMDLTSYLKKGQKLIDVAYEIKERVKKELGFTVNVGVSSNKLLAKMASDFQKPDKVHTLYKEEIETKMWNLPISELFMVGKKSIPKLERMQIKTIGDLAKKDEKEIIRYFGKFGRIIWEYSNGIDNSEVIYIEEKPKGIGNSVTLPYDYSDVEKIEKVLLTLVEQVAYRLRKTTMLAKTVNVQIKTNEFKVYSHQRKLDTPTSSTKIIYSASKKLLEELYNGIPIRLIGIRVDNLCEKEEIQISLFDNKQEEKQNRIDNVIDNLKEKYGYDFIKRASNISQNKSG